MPANMPPAPDRDHDRVQAGDGGREFWQQRARARGRQHGVGVVGVHRAGPFGELPGRGRVVGVHPDRRAKGPEPGCHDRRGGFGQEGGHRDPVPLCRPGEPEVGVAAGGGGDPGCGQGARSQVGDDEVGRTASLE
jgi:hypothetical protein